MLQSVSPLPKPQKAAPTTPCCDFSHHNPGLCPATNEDSRSRSRHAKKITSGICLISESRKLAYLRGLFFEHNATIGQVSEPTRLRKDHLWVDTSSKPLGDLLYTYNGIVKRYTVIFKGCPVPGRESRLITGKMHARVV